MASDRVITVLGSTTMNSQATQTRLSRREKEEETQSCTIREAREEGGYQRDGGGLKHTTYSQSMQ